ncbi:hypothetical protein IW148_004510 [Coemansia sp. RSA 1199]|nr:hypothetical protein IW148_004510 [Coemansia sp. RSA 1199]
MHTQSSPVTPASLVPVDDPLVHILGCLSQPNALEQLCNAHKSPDTRASLRLIAPAFMNALGTASAAAKTIALRSMDSNSACGTALVRLLVEHTLEGSDAAAAMLVDLLDNVDAAACVTRRVSPQQIADNILLSRVKTQNANLDDFARLLSTLNEHSSATDSENRWIRELLLATAEAVADIPNSSDDHEHNSTQVLCLFSLLLIMYQNEAVRVLNSLDSTRKLVRHVINMLSRPSPLIAAPALHVLSRILLHPLDNADPALQRHTTLSILAVSPGRKLFDDTHMSRTLVLAADMCLNCVAADMSHSATVDAQTELVASDLRVLDAVAGVVQACASAQSMEARAWFFQSTAMVPAILHLVSMSELDRRYLNPLLCIVNSILSLSEGNTLPLVAALVQPSQRSQHESAPQSPQTKPSDELSIIDKIVELVISSIEDVADTVPRFTLPPIGLGSSSIEAVTSSNGLDFSWPRVSSDESGCGWFVNCTQKQRRSVLLFLQHALQTDQDQYWVHELFVAVTQIIGDFVHLSKSPEADPSAGDPFGVSQNTAGVDGVKARARAEQQMLAIGSYYWTIKPILTFVADLIGLSSSVAVYWREQLCSNGMAGILSWAQFTCQHATSNSDVPMDRALYNDVCDILMPLSNSKYSESQQQSSRNVRPSVATPSDSSSSSSSAASPRLDRSDIAIDDLRAASFNNGLGVTTTDEKLSCGENAAGLIQAAVICYWARTCQIELAMLVLRCNCISANDASGVNQLACLEELVQQSRAFVAPPLMQQSVSPFLGSLVFASTVQQRSQQEHTAQQTALLQRFKEQADNLVDLEEDNARMQGELRLQKTHVSQQSAQYTQQQEEIRTLEAAKRELEASASEHQKQRQQMETDASEWKEECIRTRDDLEQSGVLLTTAHEQLAQLTDKHTQLEDTFAAKQADWERMQQTMTDNVRKLELALGEAVARLRQLESQNAAERAIADELRAQQAVMGAKLAEYSKLSETLFSLSRLPH